MKLREWQIRMHRLPDRECYLLHGSNIVTSSVLFAIFWVSLPAWIRVPYAVFYGAVLLNSICGLMVRREVRALEEAESLDAVDPPADASSDRPRA